MNKFLLGILCILGISIITVWVRKTSNPSVVYTSDIPVHLPSNVAIKEPVAVSIEPNVRFIVESKNELEKRVQRLESLNAVSLTLADIESLLRVITDAKENLHLKNEMLNAIRPADRFHLQIVTALTSYISSAQNPDERSYFSQHLGYIYSVSSSPMIKKEIAERLSVALSNERNEEVKARIIVSLTGTESISDFTLVKSLIESSSHSANVKLSCAQYLAKSPQPGARELVKTWFNNESTLRLRVSLASLLAMSSTETERTFFEKLQIDSDRNLRKIAKSALENMGYAPGESLDILIGRMKAGNQYQRNQIVWKLSLSSENINPALPTILESLTLLDDSSTDEEIALYFDVLRKINPNSSVVDALMPFLSVRSIIYKNREKHIVEKLRGYLLVTIADLGGADQTIETIAELLTTATSEMTYSIACAAYTVRKLDNDSDRFVPLLCGALTMNIQESIFTILTYRASITTKNATTARTEIIRSLAHIGSSAKIAIPLLQRLPRLGKPASPLSPDLDHEIACALKAINSQGTE